MTLEDSLAKLECLVNQLEQDIVSLQQLSKSFERASTPRCKKQNPPQLAEISTINHSTSTYTPEAYTDE